MINQKSLIVEQTIYKSVYQIQHRDFQKDKNENMFLKFLKL